MPSQPQRYETHEHWQRTLDASRSAIMLRHPLRAATACYAIDIHDQSGRMWSVGVPALRTSRPPPVALHPGEPRLLIALGREVSVLERGETEIRVVAQRRLRADALAVFTGLTIPGFVVLHESGAAALTCRGDLVWERALRGVVAWSTLSEHKVRITLRNTVARQLDLLDGRVRPG